MTETTFRIINIGTLSMNKFWGETERVHPVSATCTLLEVGEERLLVDPSPHPPELRQLLHDRAGLQPEDIDQVFVTHFHGDHRFGVELFAGIPWLMAAAGLQEWREAKPAEADLIGRFLPAEHHLMEGVQLYAAPGHTLALHALRTETPWGRLIVAGDAVMNREYFEAEEGYRNAVDFAVSTRTVQTIKAEADLVIPGHDNWLLNLA